VNTNDFEIELLGVAVVVLCVLGNLGDRNCFGSGVVVALYRRRLLDRSRSAHDGTF